MSKTMLALEYNSTREDLIFPEYGRFIQKLVHHCKSIEDKKERQAVAETIIEMMQQMNPPSKQVNDYKIRLWRHFFKMADFDIDVDVPGGEKPTEESTLLVPEKVPYLQHDFNWRHYGYMTRVMINKAVNMEEGAIKQGYIEGILSYMKLAYRTWNKEHFVNDEIIKSDLGVLSEHKIAVDEEQAIENLVKYTSGHTGGYGSNYKNRGNNQNRNKNNRQRTGQQQGSRPGFNKPAQNQNQNTKKKKM